MTAFSNLVPASSMSSSCVQFNGIEIVSGSVRMYVAHRDVSPRPFSKARKRVRIVLSSTPCSFASLVSVLPYFGSDFANAGCIKHEIGIENIGWPLLSEPLICSAATNLLGDVVHVFTFWTLPPSERIHVLSESIQTLFLALSASFTETDLSTMLKR